MQPLFLDITPLSEAATDAALELIFKSTHEHDDGIWNHHESPLIRKLVELFTDRGLSRMEAVKDELLKWEQGHFHTPQPAMPVTPPNIMSRWTAAELDLVKIYLQSLPVSMWGIDDHMMAIEYVIQRYLPEADLIAEADWLATKANLMGKVQANMAAEATLSQATAILAALPSSASSAFTVFNLSAQQAATLNFAKARAAENVREITNSVRHRMRSTILNHLEEVQTKPDGVPASPLQTKLFDQFAQLNKDWRRIAVTEAGEAQTQGFIASLPVGTKVKRVEQYANACTFCKKIHNVVAEVVSASAPIKNPDTQIWVGKNNIGRSASPRKRVGGVLVPRAPEEMWHLPAGLVHPHCRGRWVATAETHAGDDPVFAEWLSSVLGG
jgi:hypothetical protein